MLANYRRWVRHVGLPPSVRIDAGPTQRHRVLISLADATLAPWDFATAEEGGMWLCNQQLHRVMLLFLLWGEAGNVRHTPEALCYILHCAMSSLLLPDTTASARVVTKVPSQPLVWDPSLGKAMPHDQVRMGTKVGPARRLAPSSCRCWLGPRIAIVGSSLPTSPSQVPNSAEGDYLQSIITPLYRFLNWQVAERHKDHISLRVMYDDVNECFWQRAQLEALNPALMSASMSAQRDERKRGDAERASLTAYSKLRERLSPAAVADHNAAREGYKGFLLGTEKRRHRRPPPPSLDRAATSAMLDHRSGGASGGSAAVEPEVMRGFLAKTYKETTSCVLARTSSRA